MKLTLALPALVLLCLTPSLAHAQIEEGKVLKYYTIDPKAKLPDELPALTIDDLRKLTLYSKLEITEKGLEIDDSKYMRRMEEQTVDPDLTIVTSDNFRFSVVRKGTFDLRLIPKPLQGKFKFLWVKHATRETFDGKPWLKDLILLPYIEKTRMLQVELPALEEKKDASGGMTNTFFLNKGDSRAVLSKAPPPEQCVVGTLKVGKSDFLVLDLFANFTWWGKVTQLEYVALRGATADVIDQFHKETKTDTVPKYQTARWRSSTNIGGEVYASNTQALDALSKRAPQIMNIALNSEKKEKFEDLLRLEFDDTPSKLIDQEIDGMKLFGDLLAWAAKYYANNAAPDFPLSWKGPLDEKVESKKSSQIVATRALRYAFRRKGFPAQVIAIKKPDELKPILGVHVYIPSQRVSFVLYSGDLDVTIFAAESTAPYRLPWQESTQHGKLQVFEIPLGGEPSSAWLPLPTDK